MNMDQREKNLEARMEDHIRKMEQRLASLEKSMTKQQVRERQAD